MQLVPDLYAIYSYLPQLSLTIYLADGGYITHYNKGEI